MRRALSGLTTRGRCLLAAGIAAALCSLVLDERDLLRVAVFLVMLPVLATALAAGAQVRLLAARALVPGRVAVGADAEVRLELRSAGRVPAGGLLLEDGVPYALGGRPRFVVERLPRNETTVLTYPLRPVQRGVHHVGPLMARVTDPFGLAEFERELAGHGRLTVVPRVVPLSGVPTGSGLGAGEDGSLRMRSGQGEDDAVVRPWRQGDDMRKVHWRSTARRDELMVRVEERPWRGGTTVLLDRRSAAHRGNGPTSSLEWAISLTASVCLHLQRHGHDVRLVTETGAVLAGTSANGGHVGDVVLDALAGLTPSHGREMACGSDPGGGHELVAVLGATTPAAAAELIRWRPRGARSLAVLVDVAGWATGGEEKAPAPEEAARLLRGAGWRVAVARVDTTMAAVWSELCRPSAVSPEMAASPGGRT
ncbi:Uncharacterized conserved protein, DUF58 family, contains vWF domain [Streptoalloteichus tenebrarius]|uniref:Uncharacterized conserved protein, DUF58 family, contains vWF domain n=1 Tax=Streptoalloteichus tenebrarius (strain ATCC 17920 / DSM 40477 / JCM 4838 / CBS 697.72 / NBRC 16177 / NCIMB 11028 / NRRL B-12390 / A12253. 1 / ISP 5477) TaxID=1933 RepID=A0ABT1HN63_STRSD|nr:DUF58 domain-containing protein [Streptoalloteichus tenebrarius]MCP2256953.1 Uncharacterized conserved protein, DUF58 family, contains vWF domain [Streptoalloteichus tenebrarius]BFF00135.1 DUF58 domain-containing protein [Streptoalloteichus tenebrarius]